MSFVSPELNQDRSLLSPTPKKRLTHLQRDARDALEGEVMEGLMRSSSKPN